MNMQNQPHTKVPNTSYLRSKKILMAVIKAKFVVLLLFEWLAYAVLHSASAKR